MSKLRRLPVGFAVLFVAASTAVASPITVGFLSFDTDAPVAGQKEVSVYNLTGLTFGCSVADATPVCEDLLFTNMAITVNYLDGFGQMQQSILNAVTSAAPGIAVPSSFVFPGTQNITSILFAATLSKSWFVTTDGSTFQASTQIFSAPLLPGSNGISLLTVNAAPASVPEPAAVVLVISAIAAGLAVRRGRTL